MLHDDDVTTGQPETPCAICGVESCWDFAGSDFCDACYPWWTKPGQAGFEILALAKAQAGDDKSPRYWAELARITKLWVEDTKKLRAKSPERKTG